MTSLGSAKSSSLTEDSNALNGLAITAFDDYVNREEFVVNVACAMVSALPDNHGPTIARTQLTTLREAGDPQNLTAGHLARCARCN